MTEVLNFVEPPSTEFSAPESAIILAALVSHALPEIPERRGGKPVRTCTADSDEGNRVSDLIVISVPGST